MKLWWFRTSDWKKNRKDHWGGHGGLGKSDSTAPYLRSISPPNQSPLSFFLEGGEDVSPELTIDSNVSEGKKIDFCNTDILSWVLFDRISLKHIYSEQIGEWLFTIDYISGYHQEIETQ